MQKSNKWQWILKDGMENDMSKTTEKILFRERQGILWIPWIPGRTTTELDGYFKKLGHLQPLE